MPEPSLHLYGDHGAEFYLKGVAWRAKNLKPALEEIGQRMLKAERELFERHGARGGPPWKPLDEDTIARKRRAHYPDPEAPLIATGDLMRSLSERSHPLNIFNVTRSSVYIGSRSEKLDYNRRERPPIRLGEKDETDYAQILNTWIIHGWID
jgi:hypothetical protein